jgi:beta-lactamase regulating signal transducer with metallopeptidase domain/DNA-binding protein YbaB
MTVIDALVRHGPDLAAGTTLLLGVAALAARAHKSPLHVQRLGEAGVLTALAFVALALMPLPRPLSELTVQAEAPSAPVIVPPLDGLRRQAGLLPAADAVGVPPGVAAGVAAVEDQTATLDKQRPWPVLGATPRSTWPGDLLEQGSLAEAGATSTSPTQAAPFERAILPITGAATTTSRDVKPVSPAQPVAQTATAEPNQPLALGPILARAVLAGSLLGLAWLALGALRLASILRSSRPAPTWVAGLLPADVDASRVRLVTTDRRTGPFCVGAVRPTVVLPEVLCERERTDALRAVLLHEMGHALAGDGAGRLILTAALPVLWWHPLFWWLRRTVRLASELRADDHAATHAGKGRYARRLLDLASEGIGTGPVPLAAPSVFGSRTDLSRRIEMLMHRTDRLALRCSALRRSAQGALATGLLALAALSFGAAPASAQDAAEQIDRLHAERAELMAQVHALHDERARMAEQMRDMENVLQQMQLRLEQMEVDQMAGQVASSRMLNVDEYQRQLELSERLSQDLQAQLEYSALANDEQRRAAESALHEAMRARELAEQSQAGVEVFKRLMGTPHADSVAQELARAQRAAAEADAARQVAEELAALGYLNAGATSSDPAAEQLAKLRALGYAATETADEAATLRDFMTRAGSPSPGELEEQRTWRELLTGLAGPGSAPGGRGRPGGGGAMGASPRSMSGHDALALIERVMDQEAEIRMAEVELSRMHALAEDSLISEYELVTAQTRLELAHRKIKLVRALLEAEMHALEVEIHQCAETMEHDPGARATLVRLEAQRELLQSMFPKKSESHAR